MAATNPMEDRGGLRRDLEALLESKEAADVILAVSGSQLWAHRAILAARSPVLRTKLQGIPKENGSLTIRITNMEEEVAKQLLCFMYTDQVPNLCTYAEQLLVAAHKYGVPLLKELCEDMLGKGITVASAARMAVLAVKYSCTKLKQVTIDFTRAHNEVLATSGWEDAILSHPRIVAEICRLFVANPSEISTEESSPPDAQLRRGHLEEDMAALLESGEAADVMLRVGRRGIRMVAHRAVLVARCPTLAANLHVRQIEPSVLKQILQFLYMGRAVLDADLAGEVLAVAERLSLPELAEQCEQLLMETLTVETAATTAVVAVTNCRLNLRTAAVDLIRQYAPQVMGTDGWKAAMRDHMEAAVEICTLVAAAAAAAATAADAAAAAAAAAAADVVAAAAALPVVATPDSRQTAEDINRMLLQAAKDGAVKELRLLLAKGADVALRDGYRMTALHWAAERGYVEAVRCLLCNGAEVDARDRWHCTPLHRAAERGHRSVVTLLLERGADEKLLDIRGRTPAHLAGLKDIRYM